ncbi:MAG: PKD domain-containing protein [Bacteroidetes bacterium]|nr:MAG: PKD domain-containing protein [Bacteroidota bacterium]
MNPFLNRVLLFLALVALAGCYKNEPIPTADFSYSGNNEFKIPCTVKFTNRSTNAFSYDWYFGNDSTSTDTNPRYTYVKAGKYLVELRAYTESRREWASIRKEIVIKDTLK